MDADISIHALTDDVIFITDRGRGKSITNDAEAVVEYCYSLYGNRRIIYKDTMDDWDELKHTNGVFDEFGFGFEGDIP